ncbi:MAG: M20/M25/M40 family metallo-hydrolase [Deltaproteobacteria bacterium]|nr:M20/M25/M40 family metallo-hydrolase [Deltaproteobacteria bacterium]
MHNQLGNLSEEIRSDLIRFTQQLIRVPSVSHNEGHVADCIQVVMEELNYDLVFRDEVGNVIGIIVGSEDGPALLLSSHMDTVNLNGDEGWSEDPFSGIVENGRIYGLGAVDCKGGIASQIFAGHILEKSSLPFHGTLVVSATAGEESRSGVGTRFLLENTLKRLGINPDVAILCEPTNLNLCCGHDGWVEVEIRFVDSEPLAGRRIADVIYQDFHGMAGHFMFKGKQHQLKVFEPQSRIQGDKYEITVRVCLRVSMGESIEEHVCWARQHVHAVLEQFKNIRFEIRIRKERKCLYAGEDVEVLYQASPWMTEAHQLIFDRAKEALWIAGHDSVEVRTQPLWGMGLGSSGSVLSDCYKIPTFGFGPGDSCVAYTPNEWVRTDDLVKSTFCTAMLMLALTDSSAFAWRTRSAFKHHPEL